MFHSTRYVVSMRSGRSPGFPDAVCLPIPFFWGSVTWIDGSRPHVTWADIGITVAGPLRNFTGIP